MPIRPRLVSNVPFWILLAGSLVSLLLGVWIALDRLGVMVRTLTDQSATGVEVYAGQAYVFVGAALIGAGIVGLGLALTVAALSALRPAPAAPDGIDWSADDDEDDVVAQPTNVAPTVAFAAPTAPPAPTTPATTTSAPDAPATDAPAAAPTASTDGGDPVTR